ncbi:MAG: HAD hydrolase-like protein [Pseudomonadales bacterium]|nr:HAD hydrolase-like protein [Pseudomonadales bacterium]
MHSLTATTITNTTLAKTDSSIQIKWDQIDVAFLDMDGTLLDLNYDNQVWNVAVPSAYAKKESMDLDQARLSLFQHMAKIRGSIDFYSFDYWAAYTGLDIFALHREKADLVAYRPGALAFLRWLKAIGKKVILATNAHPGSLLVKDERLNISAEVDAVVSSDQFNVPKEDMSFWLGMQKIQPFDPVRALFIDDSQPVLVCASRYGIQNVLCIAKPDSAKPRRDPEALSYPALHHFNDILPVSEHV